MNLTRMDKALNAVISRTGTSRLGGWHAELGILYAKYKPEKLMEHLKLFSARINIPRLIRVTEEYQHWAELTFLYVQYDEFDNAALIMIAHAPAAWEHTHFKDVLVKVPSPFLPACLSNIFTD